MLAIYECAACILAVLVCAALLFGTCVVFLVIIEGGRVVARTWQELTLGATRTIGRWVAVEPREP
jgi:hypothetical protein